MNDETIGRSLAFCCRYWGEMERLHFYRDNHKPLPDELKSCEDLLEGVSDAAGRQAKELLQACGLLLQPVLAEHFTGKWKVDSSGWRFGGRLQPKRKEKMKKTRPCYFGLDIERVGSGKPVSLILWTQFKAEEEGLRSCLGEHAKVLRHEDANWERGVVLVGTVAITLPANGADRFSVPRSPILEDFDQMVGNNLVPALSELAKLVGRA